MDLNKYVESNIPDYIYEKYNITNGLAYTEDQVMVHKLFVYKIPREVTDVKVNEYFSQYGKIKEVRFVPDKNPDYPNVAFVHFESPTTAARVLNFYHNSLWKALGLYNVQVCDSWHQPNCQSTKDILLGKCSRPQKSSEEDEFLQPKRDSILVLNDDCLEMIIRLMPMSCQINFARSCSRISQVFRMTCKSLYRTLFLERMDNMTQWQIRDFFDFAGDCITRIQGTLPKQNHQRILKSMSRFCINLEELDLDYQMIRVKQGPNDSCIPFILKLRKLKTLKLSEAFELSGRHLSNLSPTIETLSVRCIDVKYKHIISFCKSFRNLKELNLGKRLYISEAIVNTIAVSCQNLETLTLGIVRSDFGLFAKLPKLKNLTVIKSMRYNSCPTLLNELIEHKSDQLKSFCIDGVDCISDNDAQQISRLHALRILKCPDNSGLTERGLKYFCDLENLEEIDLRDCGNINNTALINLIIKCKKLNRVNIEGCYLISNNLIFELIRKMKEQIRNKTFMRTEPVVLIANRTYMDEDILNEPEYKAALHLVTVDMGDRLGYHWLMN